MMMALQYGYQFTEVGQMHAWINSLGIIVVAIALLVTQMGR